MRAATHRLPACLAALLGIVLLAAPAGADLPPSANPLRLGVAATSEAGGFSFNESSLFDESTGTATFAIDETGLFSPPKAGVEFDLRVDADADPKLDYVLTLVNGSADEIEILMTISSPLQPYDETWDAQHSVIVEAVDGGSDGVTVTPHTFDFDTQGRAIQGATLNGVNFLTPPFARSGGPYAGEGTLFNDPLGAGRVSDVSGPTRVPVPFLQGLTPDGKYNNAVMNVGLRLSAGDTVTVTGSLLIEKGLVGGGGGGGGDPVFGPFIGELGGKQQIKAPKIGKVVNKAFSEVVCLRGDAFEITDGESTIDGTAKVLKKGKKIRVALSEDGKSALLARIAALLSAEAGQPVTVTLRKDPKVSGSIKKGGAKAKFTVAAKIRAEMGDLAKNGTFKTSVKGAMVSKP